MIGNTCVVSGYWHVDNNPKPTSGRHIAGVKRKGYIDYFFCEEEIDLPNAFVIQLDRDRLPSLNFVRRLPQIVDRDDASLKFNKSLDGETFFNLSSIWLSKPLLLWQAYLMRGRD